MKQFDVEGVGRVFCNDENITLLIVSLEKGEVTPIQCHLNASSLLYCVQGRIEVSFVLPDVHQIKLFTISPNQVVNIPKGCWHLIQAKKDSQWLNAFDCPLHQTIFASQVQELNEPRILTSKALRQHTVMAIESEPYYYHHGNLSFPKK